MIVLEINQSTAALRCSLAHAIAHLDLGHAVGETTARFRDREERAADRLASRRLIDLDQLTDAVLCSTTPPDRRSLASTLWVDTDTLGARLEHLHPSERAAIRRALANRDNEESSCTD